MAKRVTGGSKLRRQLRMFERAFEPGANTEITKAIETAARELTAEIRTRAPKDDMDLANAVQYKMSSDGLGANIGYSANKAGFRMKWKRGGFVALFQEFGTRHHAAQPFIRPSFRSRLRRNLDLIDDAVRRTVRRIVNSP